MSQVAVSLEAVNDLAERVAQLERIVARLGGQLDPDKLEAKRRALAALGVTEAEALEGRARVAAFLEDWNHPGGELYDDL